LSGKSGRPTKVDQIQIQNKLRKYFEIGISASLASQKTGINIKTVCKYFDEWAEQILEVESTAFLERQKKERTRVIMALDSLIIEAQGLLDSINSEIEKSSSEKKKAYLFGIKLSTMKFISDLIEKKTSFAMKPIMDEALKSEISEMMKNAAIGQLR